MGVCSFGRVGAVAEPLGQAIAQQGGQGAMVRGMASPKTAANSTVSVKGIQSGYASIPLRDKATQPRSRGTLHQSAGSCYEMYKPATPRHSAAVPIFSETFPMLYATVLLHPPA